MCARPLSKAIFSTVIMARRISFRDPERAIQIIEEDGGVILEDFSSLEQIRKVNADAEPYLRSIAAARVARSEKRGTVRCSRLFGRSKTAREELLQQPELQQILEHFLRTVTTSYNSDDLVSTPPILSAASTLDIGPGEPAQNIHRDDFMWNQVHHTQKTYTKGSDVGIGLLVAGVPTCFENGATLFVPGSHLWGEDRRPKPEEIKAAEMNVGEAFFFLGSTAHAGGANKTQQSRTVHGFFFCRSYIRPEENQHLWWTKEEVEKWSLPAQKQACYRLNTSWGVGHCDEKDPIDIFRASDKTINEVNS